MIQRIRSLELNGRCQLVTRSKKTERKTRREGRGKGRMALGVREWCGVGQSLGGQRRGNKATQRRGGNNALKKMSKNSNFPWG